MRCHPDAPQMYLKLCVIYLITVTTSTLADYIIHEDCQRLTRRSRCECFHRYIKCGPITLNTFDELSQIRCNSTVQLKDYEALPNLKVGSLRNLTITNCPFPDKYAVNEALTRLGITRVAYIKVQNGFDVTDGRIKPDQQHYEDMSGFKRLGLFRFRQPLPENYFEDCKNIKELVLSGYSDLPAKLLYPLKNLEYLKIYVTNMDAVSGEIFSTQHHLTELDLDCAMLKENENKSVLSGVMLSQLLELRQFSMRDCGDGVPRMLFKHNSLLEDIQISSDVQRLDKELFSRQNNLLNLKLTYNKLESLPLDIFKPLTKLRTLYLAHNRFENIPSKLFDNLRYLQVLNLEGNPLKNIDVSAFKQLRSKIYIDKLYDKVLSGELTLQTDATLCKEEYLYGVCRFCKREEYLDHFAKEEKCKAIE